MNLTVRKSSYTLDPLNKAPSAIPLNKDNDSKYHIPFFVCEAVYTHARILDVRSEHAIPFQVSLFLALLLYQDDLDTVEEYFEFENMKRPVLRLMELLHFDVMWPNDPIDFPRDLPVFRERWTCTMNTSLPVRASMRQKLGQGTFGRVYESVLLPQACLEDQVRCAAKSFLLSDIYVLQAFCREIAILNLFHKQPFVPLVYHVKIPRNFQHAYVFMEQGVMTLETAIVGARETQIYQWIVQMFRGLFMAHSHHPPVFHRDLKPANIMIRPDQTLMIIDWGSSNSRAIYVPRRELTTVWYRPPEQFVGTAQMPQDALDLWSAGCIAFEMMTGQPLFNRISLDLEEVDDTMTNQENAQQQYEELYDIYRKFKFQNLFVYRNTYFRNYPKLWKLVEDTVQWYALDRRKAYAILADM